MQNWAPGAGTAKEVRAQTSLGSVVGSGAESLILQHLAGSFKANFAGSFQSQEGSIKSCH